MCLPVHSNQGPLTKERAFTLRKFWLGTAPPVHALGFVAGSMTVVGPPNIAATVHIAIPIADHGRTATRVRPAVIHVAAIRAPTRPVRFEGGQQSIRPIRNAVPDNKVPTPAIDGITESFKKLKLMMKASAPRQN